MSNVTKCPKQQKSQITKCQKNYQMPKLLQNVQWDKKPKFSKIVKIIFGNFQKTGV